MNNNTHTITLFKYLFTHPHTYTIIVHNKSVLLNSKTTITFPVTLRERDSHTTLSKHLDFHIPPPKKKKRNPIDS